MEVENGLCTNAASIVKMWTARSRGAVLGIGLEDKVRDPCPSHNPNPNPNPNPKPNPNPNPNPNP